MWVKNGVSSGSSSTVLGIKNFYNSSKNGKKLTIIGDSTSSIGTSPAFQNRLTNVYGKAGSPLEGLVITNRAVSGTSIYGFVRGSEFLTAINDNADLYIICYGINDIRDAPNAQNRLWSQIRTDLKALVDALLSNTNAYIIMRIPNMILSANVIQTYLNDVTKAQEYTQQLWEIYQYFKNYNSRVDVVDVQQPIFGRISVPSHIFMTDTLHPNEFGLSFISDLIAERLSNNELNPSQYPDYKLVANGVIVEPTTDLTTTNLKFRTTSTNTLQVNDIVYMGNSYSFVIKNTPVKNGNDWTIAHSHTGDISNYGSIKILRSI